MYFDTHAHYDNNAFRADRDTVLRGLPELGISLALCPGCDLDGSRQCVALAQEYPFLYAAVGIHPHDAQDAPQDYIEQLAAMAQHPKVVAIGEMGLDYYYNHSPREVQRTVFAAQLDLAARLGLPAIVHNRDAHADTLATVQAHPDVPRGVYHCYTGGLEDAKTLVKLGWSFSFGGAITFANARRALEVIAWLPLDRIMLETDAPYLTPVPFRGKRNDSSYVPIVAEAIAKVREMQTEEIARITTENGMRFFGIEAPAQP